MADKVENAALTIWALSFGVPNILLTRKYSRFIWSKFSQFCNERPVTLQAVIPCHHHQSLRDTERRHMYFKDISHEIVDKRAKGRLRT